MQNFIVKHKSDDIFLPMTNELKYHIERIKKNVQTDCCVKGYLPVLEKTALKRRMIICRMIDWMATTNTGRKILSMMNDNAQIHVLSKRNKKDGDNLGESYGPEQCIVLNPHLLYFDMQGECIDTLAHEMAHLVHYNLRRHILKKTYDNLNPYDEFCLSFFDEVSSHVCGAKVMQECIGKSDNPISIADIMTSKMYWHWHYSDVLWQLTDYRRPLRQTKNHHTPSYYKLWRAYFEMHPELKWPELVRCVQLGAKKMLTVIHSDMVRHHIEPSGKELVRRYYPLLRRLRVQMSRVRDDI